MASSTSTALILVDLQNDYFPGGKWMLEGTELAVAKAASLLAHFRSQKLPIFHIRHEFPTADAPFFVPGSSGAEIHPAVAPQPGEPVILKTEINGFKDTDLKQQLDQQGIQNLVICGAMSHICIDALTRAASDFGFQCSVVSDACATLSVEFDGVAVPAATVHAAFMAALQFGYAEVVNAADLIARSAAGPITAPADEATPAALGAVQLQNV